MPLPQPDAAHHPLPSNDPEDAQSWHWGRYLQYNPKISFQRHFGYYQVDPEPLERVEENMRVGEREPVVLVQEEQEDKTSSGRVAGSRPRTKLFPVNETKNHK